MMGRRHHDESGTWHNGGRWRWTDNKWDKETEKRWQFYSRKGGEARTYPTPNIQRRRPEVLSPVVIVHNAKQYRHDYGTRTYTIHTCMPIDWETTVKITGQRNPHEYLAGMNGGKNRHLNDPIILFLPQLSWSHRIPSGRISTLTGERFTESYILITMHGTILPFSRAGRYHIAS